MGEGKSLNEAKETAYDNLVFKVEGFFEHAIKEIVRKKNF